MKHILSIVMLSSLAVFASLLVDLPAAANDAYDPLGVPRQRDYEKLDLIVTDTERRRDIPVLLYFSRRQSPMPMVLFSHGLSGSREGNGFMGKHWAVRGYVVAFVQHPGSDTSVWQGKPVCVRMQAMKRAASSRNFLLRVKDIPAVLDQFEDWNKTPGHPLAGRLDLSRIGMSGHSFGAITTQAVSGQQYWQGKVTYTDLRIKAAIAFSPSSPRRGDADQAFGHVKIPWMLMTGTKDIAFVGDADMKSRLAVFPALPPGGKYEVVLHHAEHSAFTERALPGDSEKRNPNHHRVILALSTAFWDAWLRGDIAAQNWLAGEGPHSVMEKGDLWQLK